MDIGDLWTRFMGENLAQQIGNKISDDVYCVYTEYETDHTGYYTAVLGCAVNSLDEILNDFTNATIPAGTYKIYSLAGKFPDNISEAWRQIWGEAIARAYTADFDLYTADPKRFEETEAKIYIAIK